MYAAIGGHLATVEALIRAVANVDLVNRSGKPQSVAHFLRHAGGSG